jgi:hypothetical protein
MSEKRRPECGGSFRVIDAATLTLECRRCGLKVAGKRGEEAKEADRPLV